MKLETAQAMRDLTVRYLKDMIVIKLGDGSMSLHELQLWLKTLCRNDGPISEACTELLTEDTIYLDMDRIMHLSERVRNDE